jgi:transglutaminase-like putative cysteine protease
MKRRYVILIFSILLLFSCSGNGGFIPDRESINSAISKGDFSEAQKLIGLYLLQDSIPSQERLELSFKAEQLDRIKKDFNKADTSVVNYVKKHYPGVTDEQIKKWIENNALENMMIDGKRMFFARSARNLFRIDSTALANFDVAEAREPDSLARLLAHLIPAIVKETPKAVDGMLMPKKMRIKYTITVKPDIVPEGEIVRVWLPYPRSDKKYQTDIKLIATSQPDYLISPSQYLHSSMYMEGRAKKGENLTFGYTLEYTSYARRPQFDYTKLQAYDTSSELYKDFTAERAPHILFSENIKNLVKEIVGSETNPYLKVKKIYEWIDTKMPWAGAREYSTIDNIPEYVLKNGHGDCGQVSLLFITMARYAGVPAKWQSGFMMQPGNDNLHDWAEVYYEGVGWVPVDQSFGRVKSAKGDDDSYYYFTRGLDPYRLVLNDDISADFYPAKVHFRSETVDFQRGEVEWRGGNLYFDLWRYNMDIEYLNNEL